MTAVTTPLRLVDFFGLAISYLIIVDPEVLVSDCDFYSFESSMVNLCRVKTCCNDYGFVISGGMSATAGNFQSQHTSEGGHCVARASEA